MPFYFVIYRAKGKYAVSYATAFEMGAVAASIVLQPTVEHIMKIARGYPLYPNSGEIAFELPLPTGIVLSLAWMGGTLVVALTMAYRQGGFSAFNLIELFRGGSYAPVSTSENGQVGGKNNASNGPSFSRDAPPVPDAFNMFDPADLPPRLAEYANMVYSACEDLGNFFGF